MCGFLLYLLPLGNDAPVIDTNLVASDPIEWVIVMIQAIDENLSLSAVSFPHHFKNSRN